MGKQKKNRKHSGAADFGLDKPSYAADIPVVPKKQDKHARKETDISVGEHLAKTTLERLAAMKSALQADANDERSHSRTAGKSKAVPGKQRKTAQERIAEDPDLSFAELFDPVDDEEDSFETLLKESKLDWRTFKE